MWRKKESGGWLAGCSGSSRPSSILQPDGADGKGTGPPLRLYAAKFWSFRLSTPLMNFQCPLARSQSCKLWKAEKLQNFGHFSAFARPTWNATDMRERREFLFFPPHYVVITTSATQDGARPDRGRKWINHKRRELLLLLELALFSFLFKSDDIKPGSRGTLYSSFLLLLRRWLEIFWRGWFMNQAGNLIFEIWRCQFGTGESL